ncbi:DUF2889 domain-containing protein [Oleispirillum naphthae]|uniref:DUF2889 domain-containing protein n=1 Tax=Oleispirillum naphthae TaxID=2838853 RepID=UPI0030823C55
MPLTPPSPRRLVHQRTIVCTGYAREDGLWEIEGGFADTKSETYREGDQGPIPAGVPLHGMRLRLVVDDSAQILSAEAEIGNAPFAICPLAAPLAAKLAGLSIGKGFMTEARRIIGGAKGCTHVLELLSEVAATAFQTLHEVRWKENDARDAAGLPPRRPAIIDTCHALRADGPVVRLKWPEFARDPKPGND